MLRQARVSGGRGADPWDPGVSWPDPRCVTGSRQAADPLASAPRPEFFQVTVNREVALRGCGCLSKRGSFSPWARYGATTGVLEIADIMMSLLTWKTAFSATPNVCGNSSGDREICHGSATHTVWLIAGIRLQKHLFGARCVPGSAWSTQHTDTSQRSPCPS